ncbi:hypothetical protein ACK9YZ_31955 [Rhizobium sp. ZK1]|uniref:hypothetical protein n=1 Tax=Rhizobium sp. ZK1 TaxID=3389872 RepID=UPI0039F6A087
MTSLSAFRQRPGSAIASLFTGRWEAALFAVAMLAAMFAYRIVSSRQVAPLRAH